MLIAKYNRAEVATVASVIAELKRAGNVGSVTGGKYRSHTCPACGESDTKNGKLVADHYGAQCFVCGAHFSVFDIVMLNNDCSFVEALSDLGERYGVSKRPANAKGNETRGTKPSPPVTNNQRIKERPDRLRSVVKRFTNLWMEGNPLGVGRNPSLRLAPRHTEGEEELRRRGLAALIGKTESIRFTTNGCPAVAISDIEHGVICGAQFRKLRRMEREGEPNQRSLYTSVCSGSVLGWPIRLPFTKGPIVLAEGLYDYLSALVMFPDALCLGLPGVSNAARVMQLLTTLAVQYGRDIVLALDADSAGAKYLRVCAEVAMTAGMAFLEGLPGQPTLRVWDLLGSADLNEQLTRGEVGHDE